MNPEETRERILGAADALFGTLGFDGTTTRDIAERSGVNKALIHYHFGTKDDLLSALLDGYYRRMGEALTKALASVGTPREQVLTVLDLYADFLAANLTFCRLVQREVAGGSHVHELVLRTLPMFQVGVPWLKHAVPGAKKELDATQLLVTVYGLVVTYFTHGEVLRELTGKDPYSPAALAARKRHVRRVAEVLLDAVEEAA